MQNIGKLEKLGKNMPKDSLQNMGKLEKLEKH